MKATRLCLGLLEGSGPSSADELPCVATLHALHLMGMIGGRLLRKMAQIPWKGTFGSILDQA